MSTPGGAIDGTGGDMATVLFPLTSRSISEAATRCRGRSRQDGAKGARGASCQTKGFRGVCKDCPYQNAIMQRLQRKATELGFQLVPVTS